MGINPDDASLWGYNGNFLYGYPMGKNVNGNMLGVEWGCEWV